MGHRDRHAHIGEGTLGRPFFGRLGTLAPIPSGRDCQKVIETRRDPEKFARFFGEAATPANADLIDM